MAYDELGVELTDPELDTDWIYDDESTGLGDDDIGSELETETNEECGDPEIEADDDCGMELEVDLIEDDKMIRC